ncbi:uncharacterized protein LOC126378158 isoform X3 [Pectinophora gossypiella]|uniref:uncharacterized protein LOC126378158 isoform X3 n=1 Tax=Pectinophora gossypiella TaxID=13191 RepID=UPI00214E64C4|nr:uncharacterized protein LOC126378158 isoform X3 [Pectinophora gossypiella]
MVKVKVLVIKITANCCKKVPAYDDTVFTYKMTLPDDSDKLKRLISERGYVKSCLTRIERFCASGLETASLELLQEKRTRLVEILKEYEKYNKEILFLNPDDKENPEEYEKKRALAMENTSGEKMYSFAADSAGTSKGGKPGKSASFVAASTSCSPTRVAAANTNGALPG